MVQRESYELTNPQMSIWNMEEYFKGTTINNICTSAIVYEKIDEKVLKQAINKVVEKNDCFRIQIHMENGIPMQSIMEFEVFDIETVYIKNEVELREIEKQEVTYKFNILNSYLFKFKIAVFENGFGAIILTVNHIISDSWSLGLVIQNILKEYHALKNNEILEESNTSYVQYIKSEEEYKKSEKYQLDKKFWDNTFETIPEITMLPSTKEISNKFTYKAKRETFVFNKKIIQSIEKYCETNKISIFNFLMSIYSIYVGRISNLEDFVIGTPILNRTNYKEKQTMGMFVNMVPVRINIKNTEKFTEFAHSFGINMMGFLKHQRYSYEQILHDIRKKDANIPSLYNILISYQVTKAFKKELGLYKTDWVFNNYLSSDFNIHISDINDTGELIIYYDYLIDKYNADDIEDMHERIENMIMQVTENNDILLNQIEIITNDEKNKIIYEFNKTDLDYDKSITIVDMFEEQVKKTPDNIAVVFEEKSITYKELNEKANSLAFYLRKSGIGRNDLVGIMVNRSIEMIVGILAALKAGGAYIPIDPTYPKDRIEYMLNSSNAKILLTQKHLENKLNFPNKLFIDLNNEKIYELSSDNLDKINEPEDLAYVIFTSGSTGVPKGVMLIHKSLSNLTNYCNNYIEYLKKPTNQTIVSITTVSFDIFLFETIISLQKGLKLVIANENEKTTPQLLNNLMQKHNIEIIQTTPSVMQMFVNNIENIPAIKKLKYITLAGEQLPLKLINQLSKLSNAVIYNGYGPSETTVFSTLTKMNNDKVTIGKPLSNTKIYILDKNLQPMPIGVPGEIYIAGDGVGKGYLYNEELTSKSYIPNPFIPNSIMYKTGDMGIYLNTGEIVCLGRVDHQVKIRGLRIELGEIEEKLSKINNIKTCVVIKQSDNSSHEFLCAYYTTDGEVNSGEIRKELEKILPNYMIPQYIMELKELPYTPNGKIDRKNLPKPQIVKTKSKVIKPRNEIDEKLVEILKDLLKLDTISIDDSFFELGGDSLSAINLCVIIQSEFNTEIFVRNILEHPTVKEISDIIIENKDNNQTEVIPRVEEAECYPVSRAQKRMFLTSTASGKESILYNMPGGIILEGKVNEEKIQQCLNKLIDRHESLRTYFEVKDGNVVQKIEEKIELKLEKIDARYDEIERIFNEFVQPFDLSKAPLFRAKLIKYEKEKSILFVDMHHIISDGTSLSIFTEEMIKLYNDEELPQLKITYKDYATYENNQLENGKLKESENYWLKKFAGEIPVLDMPIKSERPAIQSYEGKKIYDYIDEKMKREIEKKAEELKVTPYMILLSAYYILLSKYTSGEDIIIGTSIVGRDKKEIHNLIGMFVNTLAIREKIDSNITIKEFILQLKENLLESYKYQTYPFDELVNKLKLNREADRNPIFDVMFIYQNNGYKKIESKTIKTEYYMPDTKISKLDLSIEAVPEEQGIKINVEYSTQLFEEKFIENLTKNYLNTIKEILKNTEEEIGKICILTEEEKNKVIYEFNNTKVEYPRDKTIIQLFEEQVNDMPNNIAVVFEDQQLTFKELNEKANSLANYLRKNGIKRSDTIGIMLNRSLEVMVAILAVLKAGGAYVPIDPTFPKERIKYMLDSCNIKVLLTQKKLENKVEFENKECIELSNNNIYDMKSDNLENVTEPEDIAYIIFTSGSTGKPKGVVLRTRNVVNFIYGMRKNFEYEPGDALISTATISFDMFVFESLQCMANGVKVVIANKDEQVNVNLYNDLSNKNNVNIFELTPSKLQAFTMDMNYLTCLKNAKYILIGGEPFQTKVLEKIKTITKATIYNMYGPTETTVWSSMKKIEDEEEITIGKPIMNTEIYILDKNENPQPIGVPGEICISGDGVAKGYLNNEKLTNDSFKKNPFIENKIMYKTGDMGKFTEKGEIIHLGRIDHQIKIRGLRIELGEIENHILEYPNIKKVVVVKGTIQDREYIVAYYVSTKKILINELRNFLLDLMPKYMLPTYFIPLDDLPYNNNGKVDKKALPLPTEIINVDRKEFVAPKNDLQRTLVEIWERVLNIEPIGITDNFFEIGGDSLLAMNLNIELLKISNNISYSDIFRFPTILEQEEKIKYNIKNPLFGKIENLSDNYENVLNDCKKNVKIGEYHPKGVLLTGATGFLGIHILREYIENEDGKIYCIVREDPGIKAETKLKQKLNYYFGEKYDHLINKKIFVVHGNIKEPNFGLNEEKIAELSEKIDVVINSAALVSHYGQYDRFYDTNVNSVKYLIDYCKKYNKKLYHISTLSVVGSGIDKEYLTDKKIKKDTNVTFDESSLYVGQIIENVYERSKFEAENCVLEAIGNGLNAYIMRMGNLMPRKEDGKFQENISENNFINKIIAFIKMGEIPSYMSDILLEITPIDYAANAVYKIITHPTNNNRVFHIYNKNHIRLKNFVKLLNTHNYNIKIIEEDEFIKKIKLLLADDNLNEELNNLVYNLDENLHMKLIQGIKINAKFTNKYLNKINFNWCRLSKKYLEKFIKLLEEKM